MPELSGRDLLHEWQKLMASVGAAPELPRQLLEPMRRQLELVQDIVERERRLRKELAGQLVAPVDAVLGLLEESGATMRRQAEALEAAGGALQDAGRLMNQQVEAFDRTIGLLQQPAELARRAAGVERRPRKRSNRKKQQPRAARRRS